MVPHFSCIAGYVFASQSESLPHCLPVQSLTDRKTVYGLLAWWRII